MVIFAHGEDSFRLREKVRALKERFAREVDASQVSILEVGGKSVSADRLYEIAVPGGLFVHKRMIVIHDCMQLSSEAKRDVISLLPQMEASDNVILFLHQGEDRKKDPLWEALAGVRYSFSFPLLAPTEVSRWVEQRIRQRGGTISSSAVRLLVAEVGNNLWQMAQEVEKLVAYANGRRIEQEDVETLVRGAYDPNIFALTDAVAQRQASKALAILEKELRGGANPLYLHTMLVRQFRIMVQVKGELASSGGKRIAPAALARTLRLHPYVAQKAIAQASRFTFSDLQNAYRRLLDIETSLKSSSVPADVLFSLFVASF